MASDVTCNAAQEREAADLRDVRNYAYKVWHLRNKPDTSYNSDFQRLKKWPEPSNLNLDYDVHYRNRPQPTK